MRRISGLICVLLAVPPGVLAWQRADLPYNEAGRYFDAATGVVYHQQGVAIWATIAAVSVLAGVGLLLWRGRPRA